MAIYENMWSYIRRSHVTQDEKMWRLVTQYYILYEIRRPMWPNMKKIDLINTKSDECDAQVEKNVTYDKDNSICDPIS